MFDKNSLAYKKYGHRYDPNSPENVAKRKKEKSEKRRTWWAANWIALLGIFLAAIALIVSIFSLRIAWLSYRAECGPEEITQGEAYSEPAQRDADNT